MPEISVIVASYNTANYISACIDSVLAQEDVSFEIIIADDASTDESWSIISSFVDPRITARRLARNKGPGGARNEAIALAKGTWIAVLDADDRLLPGRLKRLFDKARAVNADIVVDNVQVFRERDGLSFPMFPPQAWDALGHMDHALFIGGTLPGVKNYTLGYVKPLFSAEFLRTHALRYDEAIPIGEDYVLLSECLARGARCAVEPAAGYRYTARAGSISHRLSLANITNMMEADRRYLARCVLSAAAARAQVARNAMLKREYAFTQMVDAIKGRNPKAFLAATISYPCAILLLRRPLLARIDRLVNRRKIP